MKVFVIAQHHGCLLTLESLKDCGITDVTVIIPGSQVTKYNKMWEENKNNDDYKIFKDYDKTIANYVKNNFADAKAFVFDDFDITNTVVSTLNAISLTEYNGLAACIMSGAIAIKDFLLASKDALNFKEMGFCISRVYQSHKFLSMYHMIGLPGMDKSVDTNFFVVDMSKISNEYLNMRDSTLLNAVKKKNQLTELPREFNGKDDVLIGTAISARLTLQHNLKIQSGYVVNLWNKSIKPWDKQTSDEYLGYPFFYYSKYAKKVANFLPRQTVKRIAENGIESDRLSGKLVECMDIIDL